MNLNFNNMIVYIACIFFLFIFGRIFMKPIKTIIKLVINSIIGGLIIIIINLIGSVFNFHMGLNLLTSIFIGILGIPGAIVMIILKLLL